MKPPKKGNVAFANGYNRVKLTRHGYMMYNANDRFVGRSLDAYGECCEEEVRFLLSLVGPDSVVLDVGANYGALTLPLARAARLVYAFEPQREVFCALAGNMALNCVANVVCENMALSDRAGTIKVPQLDFGAENNIGGLELDYRGESTQRTYAVRSETLDEYVARSQLPRIDLVKVDVEGMEAQVLRGARATLARFRPILYVENDREDKAPVLLALLAELGYAWEAHAPPLFNPRNFFGNPANVWGMNYVSTNLVCRPAPPA